MRLLLASLFLPAMFAGTVSSAPSTTWFEDARFGLFVHFGLYSVPAGVWEGQRVARNDYAEWIRMQHGWPKPGGIPKAEYDKLLGKFDPQGFDAAAWVREARNAGTRYLLVTAKHHDGFALWDSAVSGYNVVKATPFRRDILAELTAACREQGLKVGFYYSHWQDWEHPGGARPPWPEIPEDPPVAQPSQDEFEGYWTGKCLPQVKELLERFEPDFLWFDSWGRKRGEFLTADRLGRLIGLVRHTRPACLVNSRIGTDQGVDYLSMSDNFFPAQGFDRPWETSGTLNHSWGYHQLDFRWKPVGELLRNLVDNASRGGNYQLNVGPTGAGVFQPAAIRRLREIGAWMEVNAEAVRGTRPAGLPEPDWGRLTRRDCPPSGSVIYAHVYRRPADGNAVLAGIHKLPDKAYVLETRQEVKTRATEAGLVLDLPDPLPDDRISVVALEFKSGG